MEAGTLADTDSERQRAYGCHYTYAAMRDLHGG